MTNATLGIPPPPTFEEAIARLNEIAVEKGDDFRARVQRKASAGSLPETIGTWDGVRLEHLSVPEAWLLPLCGGGPVYVFSVYHASEPSKMLLAYPAPMIGGPPKPPEFEIMSRPDWRGPAKFVSAGSAPMPSTTPAVTDYFDTSRPRPVMPGGGGSGGYRATEANPGGPLSPPAPTYDYARERAELSEARALAAVEAVKRQQESDMRGLREILAQQNETLRQLATRPAPPPPPPPPAFDLEKLFVAATTALTPVLALFKESRQTEEARRIEERRIAAEAEARREAREEALRKESAMDRAALLERVGAASKESSEVLRTMAAVTAENIKSQMQTAVSMRELLTQIQPSEDTSLLGTIKELAPTIAEVFLASRGAGQPVGSAQRLPRQLAAPPAAAPPPGGGEGEEEEEEGGERDAEAIRDAAPADLAKDLIGGLTSKIEAGEIADAYLAALANPGFVELVNTGGGTLKFFEKNLDPGWIRAEAKYLTKVFATLSAKAKALGITV